MDTYDLDDDPDVGTIADGATGRAPTAGDRRRAVRWSAALAVLLLVGAIGVSQDERVRGQEFDALLIQVTQGQAAVRYTEARIQAITQYVSPQMFSAAAPEPLRASLEKIVQQAATDRIEPTQVHRDDVAALSAARWHGDQRRARSAYLAYLDDRIAFLRAASADVDVLFEPQPNAAGRLTAARTALLEVSPDDASAREIRDLLR